MSELTKFKVMHLLAASGPCSLVWILCQMGLCVLARLKLGCKTRSSEHNLLLCPYCSQHFAHFAQNMFKNCTLLYCVDIFFSNIRWEEGYLKIQSESRMSVLAKCLKITGFFGIHTQSVFEIKCGFGAGSHVARWAFQMSSKIWRPRGRGPRVCGGSTESVRLASLKYISKLFKYFMIFFK